MIAARPGLATLVVIALGVMALDLTTKALALRLPPEGVALVPGLNLSLGFNRGVSFGLFADTAPTMWIALFTGTALAILAVLGARAAEPLERISYALILGGGLANLADRLVDRQVTDFLDLHAAGWHFPTFNLADVAISIGVILVALHGLRLAVSAQRS